jgi:hypothetical protein
VNFNRSHGTLVSSDQHVIYGASSGLATCTPDYFALFTGQQYGQDTGGGLDLTGYNTVKLDVYISQADGGDLLFLALNPRADWSNQTGGAIDNTPAGTTGAFTLTCDISTWPDKTSVFFDIESFNETPDTLTAYLGKLYAA